jgi:alginate production protein
MLTLNLLLPCLLALLPAVQEQEPTPHPLAPGDLRVGHWIEVKGQLDAGGIFVVDELLLSPPEDYETLLGTVTGIDLANSTLQIHGQPITFSEKTEWLELTPSSELVGKRLRVQGRYRGPAKFSSRDIRARGAGRDRIAGRVDGLRPLGDGLELDLLRFRVRCGPNTKYESSLPVGAAVLVPRRWTPPQDQGRVDEEDLLRESYELAPGLRFGGQAELESTKEDEYDLEKPEDGDRWDSQGVLRLRLAYRLSSVLFGRVEGRGRHLWREDEEDGASQDEDWTLGETWLYWRDALGPGYDLQIGRQDFDDRREWIYDQNLDGLRLFKGTERMRYEFSVSSTFGAGAKRDESSVNVFGQVSNLDDDKHLAAWFLHRSHEEPYEAHLTHLGVRALGDWLDPFQSWSDLALVVGDERDRDVLGWGYDLGGELRGEGWPFGLALGYAYGSGDDGQGQDSAFRQTGLQDNNARIGTATAIRYYGELVDPELSNLSIATLGLSWWWSERTALSLLGHDFNQVEAADFLRDTQLDLNPTGLSRHLGSELDLALTSRAFPNLDVEFVLGMFFPGEAFAEDDPASLLRLQLRYRF